MRERVTGRPARVTFLGTSAGMPTLTRGMPSLALAFGSEILLFDCGEGTQMQFRKAGLRPGRLTRVCISHLHGDHVLGLPGFMMSLQLWGRTTPLTVHGPPGTEELVTGVLRMMLAHVAFPLGVVEHADAQVIARGTGYTLECRPLDHSTFCLGYTLAEDPVPGPLDAARAHRLGVPDGPLMGRLKKGETVVLPNGSAVAPAQVVAPSRPGLRFTYCTDTRPCGAAAELAVGADLLVHEATFGGERAEDAHAKGHSTARDAAEIAVRAGARHLALTHISPRYHDTDELLAEARGIFATATLAEDLLTLDV